MKPVMTLRRVRRLSDEDLRVMIAIICGWETGPEEDIPLGVFGKVPKGSKWHKKSDGEGFGWQDNPPDYARDLNAMHKAEKRMLGCHKHMRYAANLWNACVSKSTRPICATARQRAEAFIITMSEK